MGAPEGDRTAFQPLVRATTAGDRRTDDEVVAIAILLFGTGLETTTNIIGNGTLVA